MSVLEILGSIVGTVILMGILIWWIFQEVKSIKLQKAYYQRKMLLCEVLIDYYRKK